MLDQRTNARGLPEKSGERAFTLVEILVVIMLVALLAGTIISGSGMLASNRLRSAAGLIVTAVRIAITRSNTQGRPVRLTFDIDGGRLLLEETTGRMLRVKETSDSKATEGAAAGADPATAAEREATEYADGIVKGPRAPRAKFKAVPLGVANEDAGKGRALGRGIHFRMVQTEHDLKPRDSGRAYLYFWPGGGTERAVVQLERTGSDGVLSVVVSPLTGRAVIQRGEAELPAQRKDESFGMQGNL